MRGKIHPRVAMAAAAAGVVVIRLAIVMRCYFRRDFLSHAGALPQLTTVRYIFYDNLVAVA